MTKVVSLRSRPSRRSASEPTDDALGIGFKSIEQSTVMTAELVQTQILALEEQLEAIKDVVMGIGDRATAEALTQEYEQVRRDLGRCKVHFEQLIETSLAAQRALKRKMARSGRSG